MMPPLVYFGAKTRIADQIVARLPAHRHYVEPFTGSLAVLLAERVCALTPHSRAEYAAAADLDGCTELERARQVWVQLTQGRSGTLRPTGWRHYCDPAATHTSMPGYLAGYRARMPAVAARLAQVSLESRPALEIITKYGAHEDVCLYVDPPYPGSTRSGATYRHEMRADSEHTGLLAALLDCRSAVVLSGYANPLYDQTLAGWSRYEIPTLTGNGGTRRGRIEVLWINRTATPTLFDISEGELHGP